MIVLFWISALIVAYVYVGYPALLGVWARVVDRRPRRMPFAAGAWPSISIIVAARNEAARLPGRVANLLAQEYPGRREIIVVSDGSTDDPEAALAPLIRAAGSSRTIRLLEVPAGGKPAALNAGVAAAAGDILVFADARQRFAPGAIAALVSNFADARVGGATGELVLDSEQQEVDTAVGEGIGLYWRYEKWLRRNESRVWSTLGATGAIYALRRRCWSPLPQATLLDDVLAPMRAVLDGCRIVFDDAAVAYDRASADAAAESRRKTRTLAGNYQILAQEPRLLVPFVNPVWLQYVSHKVGRLVVPWALVGLLVSSIALAQRHVLFALLLAAQGVFYGLALSGAMFQVRDRLARVAYTFVMMNVSAVAGLLALRRLREVWR
ncbi:MAG TPA: glycosyltransferase [Vicinamibacterales bacterium]|nr:glycosyltransferase [Vicinamibacterales bacterium]